MKLKTGQFFFYVAHERLTHWSYLVSIGQQPYVENIYIFTFMAVKDSELSQKIDSKKGSLTASASSLNQFKLIELHEALLTTAYTPCHLYSLC